MNLTKRLDSKSNRVSVDMVFSRYKNSKNPIKLRPNEYGKDTEVASAYGACVVIETILNEYRAGEYEDIEVLVGDLDLAGIHMMNKINKLTGNPYKKYKIEDLQDSGRLVKESNAKKSH